MNVIDALVWAFVGAAVGGTVMSYLKRDARGFELLVRALNLVGFYRCFGKRSEGAIEHKLRNLKENLDHGYWERDHWRSACASSPNSDFFHNALERAETYLVDYQRDFDYAVALAVLAGFGKTAMKITNTQIWSPTK